jgi:hypothetical protein
MLMIRFLSNCRPLIHAALAALVVAALSRCSWEESRELARSLRVAAMQSAGQTAPVQAPIHDCDRESGCICHGATQALAIDATHCKPTCTDLLPAEMAPASYGWVIDAAATPFSALDDDSDLPPISGRQLRALYASLLI